MFKNLQETGCVIDGVPTLKCFEFLFQNLLFISAAIVMIILFLMLMLGGFSYLTSFGNPEKVKKAQGTLKFAIIGLIVYMSSFLILKTIDIVFLEGKGKLFKFQIGPDIENP
ncbi:MAG: hypothetical protein ABIO02_05140 [Patescibacteria group bacterium]